MHYSTKNMKFPVETELVYSSDSDEAIDEELPKNQDLNQEANGEGQGTVKSADAV